MAFAIKFGDRQFRLEDLPVADCVRIARKHGVSWLDLLFSPGSDPDALADLIDLAADRNDIGPDERPGRPVSMRDAWNLLDVLVQVDDDLPSEWIDGNPPVAAPTTL